VHCTVLTCSASTNTRQQSVVILCSYWARPCAAIQLAILFHTTRYSKHTSCQLTVLYATSYSYAHAMTGVRQPAVQIAMHSLCTAAHKQYVHTCVNIAIYCVRSTALLVQMLQHALLCLTLHYAEASNTADCFVLATTTAATLSPAGKNRFFLLPNYVTTVVVILEIMRRTMWGVSNCNQLHLMKLAVERLCVPTATRFSCAASPLCCSVRAYYALQSAC
jgi:hypothetical protein